MRTTPRLLVLVLALAASAWYLIWMREDAKTGKRTPTGPPWPVEQAMAGGVPVRILSGFAAPYGIALDARDNLYVADMRDARVLRFDPRLRMSGWLGARDGKPVQASGWHQDGKPVTGDAPGAYRLAHSIAFDGAGRSYVADYGNARVQRYSAQGEFLGAFPPAPPSGLRFGAANASVDRFGNVWVADFDGHRVLRFGVDGDFRGWLGAARASHASGFHFDGEPVESAADGGLSRPHMVQVDGNGFIYVVETGNNRVQKFSPAGEALGWIGARADGQARAGWAIGGRPVPSREPGGFDHPASLQLVRDDYLLVADNANHRIQKFALDGRFLGWLGGRAAGGPSGGWLREGQAAQGREPGFFDYPFDVLQQHGHLYVADGHAGRVQVFELPD